MPIDRRTRGGGRAPSVNLGFLADQAGAYTPEATAIQPIGPLTEDQAAAGMTRLPMQAEYQQPTRSQNFWSGGRAMEKYRGATSAAAERAVAADAQLQRDLAGFENQEFITRLGHTLRKELGTDEFNRMVKHEQDKLNAEYEGIGRSFLLDRGLSSGAISREQAIAQGKDLAFQKKKLEGMEAGAVTKIPLSEFEAANQARYLETQRVPGLANVTTELAQQKSRQDIGARERELTMPMTRELPGGSLMIEPGRDLGNVVGTIPSQQRTTREVIDPATGLKSTVVDPATPSVVGRRVANFNDLVNSLNQQQQAPAIQPPSVSLGPQAAPAPSPVFTPTPSVVSPSATAPATNLQMPANSLQRFMEDEQRRAELLRLRQQFRQQSEQERENDRLMRGIRSQYTSPLNYGY